MNWDMYTWRYQPSSILQLISPSQTAQKFATKNSVTKPKSVVSPWQRPENFVQPC